MDNKIKILFCGDVEGKFNCLFNRVDSINKKAGPFSMLLCVGNFFGVNNKEFEPYRAGLKAVPVPTYILGPNKEEHVDLYSDDDFEICKNVYYLGKRGLYTSTDGIKIAYLSGISTQRKKSDFSFNTEDVKALSDTCMRGNPNFKGVDILLTSQWPTNIINNQIKLVQNLDSDLIAWLSLQLRPRYHISGLEGVYYERAPYRTISMQDSSLEIVTRFIGLARVGNASKEKWIYALNLTPLDKMKISELIQKTTDETTCPFDLAELESKVLNKKRKSGQSQQYFYDMNAPTQDMKRGKKQKKEKITFDQSKCWFCLASPSVEKHLIITVGTSTYLALAKGGLVEEHFLICPIEHYQSSIGQPENVQEEVGKFKEALEQFYARNEMVPVYFERNYKTSHMQIQAVPIPKNALNEIKDIFLEEAEGHGIKLQELEKHNRLDQVIPAGCPYFCVELPNDLTLYTRVTSSQNFPLNFGREVLASGPVLNMSGRTEWKDCILSREEEELLVQSIRTDFEPFDFTEV